MTIPTLIDKQDTFEIVRDQIATILVTEIVSQQALAVADGKDPDLWKVRIYTERSNAWEQFLEVPPVDESPICNIWYDKIRSLKIGGTQLVGKRLKVFSILTVLGTG